MTTSETSLPAGTTGATADAWRYGLIAVIAFLTLVDLFATQAILPSLVRAYGVKPSTMGAAVNASTFGMAVAGFSIAIFGRDIDRRNGIWISLAILAAPTLLLAFANDIYVFALLRVWQGLCMASAFTLTMAYLSEHFGAERSTAMLSAYVTGNVASNVFGRMLSASVADQLGLQSNFLVFAALNVVGAVLVFFTLMKAPGMPATRDRRPAIAQSLRELFADPQLSRTFAIGFLVLFVFIGTYTYVNFRLTGPVIGLSPMALGFVYLVFLPSLFTTPLAGWTSRKFGPAHGVGMTILIAICGLVLSLSGELTVVLGGLALVAIGTFLAQAIATGHIGASAGKNRAAASGVYLSSYYSGGLIGSLAVGQIFDRAGWSASVYLLVAMLVLTIVVGRGLRRPAPL